MAKKVGNTYFFTGKGKSSGGGGGGGDATDAIKYTEQTLNEPQQMQARKNQGLYYEESTEGEKTVTTPNDPFAQWPYPQENGISYGDDYFMRITDDAPAQADIIEMMISGETTVAGSDLQSFDITGSVDFPSTVQGYSANPFVSSRQMFIVVSEDTVVDGNTYKKGIYVPHIELFANPYVSEIIYNGTITTVHQIPAKYIPSVGAPAVKMEIPSMGDDVYYNMGILIVNQYVPSRDVVFSVEGHTVVYAYAIDVINGGTNGQEGDTLTFSSGGLYWVQLELAAGGTYPYVCAMVFVESGN